MGAMRFISGVAMIAAVSLSFAAQSGASVSHQVSAREASEAGRFWTPDRIAQALKRDPVFGNLATAASGNDQRANSSRLRHRPVTVYRPEVGKIFGWDRYGAYNCSGSVIDTASLRLVLTAAHCLYYGGAWANKVLFVPDFNNGRRPYGTYKAKAFWVPTRWMRNSFGTYGTHFDIGLIVTRKTWNGSRIGENVGALPVQTYPRRRGLTDIYGYPGAAMKSRFKRTCRAATRPWSGPWFLPGPTGMIARCNMAPGSSGGPWVSRYRRDGGGTIGVVDGLTSTGYYRRGRGYLTSPYFGRNLAGLIRATEGR